MFVSLLYSILHGFLFSYGVLALQTVPLEKKKQLVLFFSSSLYLFLTDLFLIARVHLLDLQDKSAVDLLNDLIYSGKEP